MSDDELIEVATQARLSAYAPYSGFKVGAAVLGRSGKAFQGCNVENLSLGLTICAERAAVAACVTDGETHIVTIAIVADGPEPAIPCGGCRQVLAEFNPATRIIASTTGGRRQELILSDLLPRANQGVSLKHV
jgi:cytidine deaminase